MNNIYVVKKMRIMSYLVEKGFRLLRTQQDRNNPRFNVFLFKDTEELRNALKQYTTEKFNK